MEKSVLNRSIVDKLNSTWRNVDQGEPITENL